MTKNDVEKLAQALKDSKPIDPKNNSKEYLFAMIQWKSTCESISMTLQYDNIRFNPARFLAACGYNQS